MNLYENILNKGTLFINDVEVGTVQNARFRIVREMAPIYTIGEIWPPKRAYALLIDRIDLAISSSLFKELIFSPFDEVECALSGEYSGQIIKTIDRGTFFTSFSVKDEYVTDITTTARTREAFIVSNTNKGATTFLKR